MTSCGRKKDSASYQLLEKQATAYSIQYLNNYYFYNNSMSYQLTSFLQSENDSQPILFKLSENEDVILSFVVFECKNETTSGDIYFEIDNHLYKIAIIDNYSEVSQYSLKKSTLSLNQLLPLENINSIVINDNYHKASELEINTVKQLFVTQEALFNLNRNDVVTIYDNLDIIRLDYDEDNNIIIGNNIDNLVFPVAVNGKIVGQIIMPVDNPEAISAYITDENEAWTDLIHSSEGFIIATATPFTQNSGITISQNSIMEEKIPVIIKKAYQQLQEQSKKQSSYDELFTFIVE